jgi:iron complex transport system substrate-binding protein
LKGITVKRHIVFLSSLALTVSLAQTVGINVKHETGTLELKQPVKRIVALEYSFLDTLIALGVKPVGAAIGTQAGDRGAPPYLKPMLAGITETGSRAAPNLEVMLSLQPEVILADAFVHKALEPNLKMIAPTAMFNSRRGSYDDLQTQTLEIGRIVGRESVAKTLIAEQTRLVDKARAFAKKNAPSFVAAVATPKSLTLHSTESFIGSLLERLGRKNAVKPQGANTQFEVSLEGLVALNPNVLVLFTAADEQPITLEWAKNPLWQKLEAVKRNRVYTFDRDLWTRSRGPIALKRIVAQAINSGLLADAAPQKEIR